MNSKALVSEKKLYSNLLEVSDSILDYAQETCYFTEVQFKEEVVADSDDVDESDVDEIIELLEGREIMDSIDSIADKKVYSGVRFRTSRFKQLVNKIEEKYSV